MSCFDGVNCVDDRSGKWVWLVLCACGIVWLSGSEISFVYRFAVSLACVWICAVGLSVGVFDLEFFAYGGFVSPDLL